MASLKFSILFLFLAIFANAQQQCLEGNCFDGKGKAQYAKGSYIGDFKNGKPDGFGSQTDESGIFVGNFKDGVAHGEGVRTYKDGSTTLAIYEKGKLIKVLQDSTDKRADGSKCMEGDCINGYGTLDFPKGDKYQGIFLNGAMHGEGNLFFSSGDVMSGKFENNKFVSGKMFGKNKSFYFEGTFQNSKPWNGESYLAETKEWINFENGKPVEKKQSYYYDDEEDGNY